MAVRKFCSTSGEVGSCRCCRRSGASCCGGGGAYPTASAGRASICPAVVCKNVTKIRTCTKCTYKCVRTFVRVLVQGVDVCRFDDPWATFDDPGGLVEVALGLSAAIKVGRGTSTLLIRSRVSDLK